MALSDHSDGNKMAFYALWSTGLAVIVDWAPCDVVLVKLHWSVESNKPLEDMK